MHPHCCMQSCRRARDGIQAPAQLPAQRPVHLPQGESKALSVVSCQSVNGKPGLQVVWMMESEVKLRSVVFAQRSSTFLWLEVGCVRGRPTAICRSRDTLEKLQGLVLGRQDFRHCGIGPLLAKMASELGPVASYHFQGFSKLTSLTVHVDDTAAFTLPPSLEDLHLGYLTRRAWWVARPASTGMGHVRLPRLRRLHVELAPWAGTEWLPLQVPSLESVQVRSDRNCLVNRRIHAGWGQDWPKAANIKSLVLRDVVCPFDAAVLHVEELHLEGCVAFFRLLKAPKTYSGCSCQDGAAAFTCSRIPAAYSTRTFIKGHSLVWGEGEEGAQHYNERGCVSGLNPLDSDPILRCALGLI
jgi:hypothetical protein